ncbi:hypothetical protein JCM10207_003480 [Rhodosporidiobolus poonsookiae]
MDFLGSKRPAGPPKRFDDDPRSWLPVGGMMARAAPPFASTSSAPPPLLGASGTPATAATPASVSATPVPSGEPGRRNRRAWDAEEERLLAEYTRGEGPIQWSDVQRKLAEKGYERKEDTVQHHLRVLSGRARAQNVPFDGPVPLAPWTDDEDARILATSLFYREGSASGRSKRRIVSWEGEMRHFPGRGSLDLSGRANNLMHSKGPAFRARADAALAKLRLERSGGTPAVAKGRPPKAHPLRESQTLAPAFSPAPSPFISKAPSTALPPRPPQASLAPPRPSEPALYPPIIPPARPLPRATYAPLSTLATTPSFSSDVFSFAYNPPPPHRMTASPPQSFPPQSFPASSTRAYLSQPVRSFTPLPALPRDPPPPPPPSPAPAPTFSPPRPARAPSEPSPRTIGKKRLHASMEVWAEGYRVIKRVRRTLEEGWEV